MRDEARKADGCEPLLKWPGGKRALLPHLLPLIPSSFKRYIEPFFGGGAFFFATQPSSALLSDSNEELINCYREIRDNPKRLLSYLYRMENSEKEYYRIRSMSPRSKTGKAARFLYLTILSFNGIYRVNRHGVFNVPYGYKTHLSVHQTEKIMQISRALTRCELECIDFEEALERARPYDLIYLDPPYTVAHGQNGFRKYNAKIFSWEDQDRLARMVHLLNKKRCYIIMSNACHSSISNLYKSFTRLTVKRPSVIAASSEYRCRVTESVITNIV